jgi:cytochrome c oxidase cbb3-type subunit 1
MELHFWMHTAGLILYVAAMWTAGVTEGLMWRATDANGALIHPFIDSLIAIRPFYLIRFLGGLLIVGGMIVMAWNLCPGARLRSRTWPKVTSTSKRSRSMRASSAS